MRRREAETALIQIGPLEWATTTNGYVDLNVAWNIDALHVQDYSVHRSM